jgi:hypothetical protein
MDCVDSVLGLEEIEKILIFVHFTSNRIIMLRMLGSIDVNVIV